MVHHQMNSFAVLHEMRARHPGRVLGACLCLVLAAIGIALFVGQNLQGWNWASWSAIEPLLFWRIPRIVGAFAAGGMLAAAGCLIQRLTNNPMASPEVLGQRIDGRTELVHRDGVGLPPADQPVGQRALK